MFTRSMPNCPFGAIIQTKQTSLSQLVLEKHIITQIHVHALSLISPAAGNLRSQSTLLGTRLRILHLKEDKRQQTCKYEDPKFHGNRRHEMMVSDSAQ